MPQDSFRSNEVGKDVLAAGEVSNLRRQLAQILATCIKNIAYVVFGLSLGMPTILIPNLMGGVPGENIVLDENGVSWIGSVNYLSVPLGCILSGTLAKALGRIRSMRAIFILFFAAFLLIHFANQAWHILLGLFMTGFSGGLLEASAIIYTVETTETNLRGVLISTASPSVIIGMILSFILGSVLPWRTTALINACIPLVGITAQVFLPESPHWLIHKKRYEAAKENLAWLRGWTSVDNIEEEFGSIVKEIEQRDEKERVSLSSFFKSTFVKPYLLICFAFLLASFGNTPINIYGVKIFQLLKAPIDSYYATVLIGVSELIGAILLIILVRFLGKRVLFFISEVGIFLNFLSVGIYTYNLGVYNFESLDIINQEVASQYNWVPLITITGVGFFSTLMISTLPWIIMGELYPNDVRDVASGISAGTGYFIGFIANKTFLNIVNSVALAGTFWLFSIVAVIGSITMYFLLPETEGKTLFEITEHYAGRSKLSNKVGTKGSRKNITGETNKGFEMN